jgi:hypothetical protein
VTGPSLTSDTCMSAPKRPVSIVIPSARSASAYCSTSGSASAGSAAPVNDGRLPLRVSASSVNCETTRMLPPTSMTERSKRPASSRKIRKAAVLAAARATTLASSPAAIPTNATRPAPITPTVSPSTVTVASVTRCRTTRMRTVYQTRVLMSSVSGRLNAIGNGALPAPADVAVWAADVGITKRRRHSCRPITGAPR